MIIGRYFLTVEIVTSTLARVLRVRLFVKRVESVFTFGLNNLVSHHQHEFQFKDSHAPEFQKMV